MINDENNTAEQVENYRADHTNKLHKICRKKRKYHRKEKTKKTKISLDRKKQQHHSYLTTSRLNVLIRGTNNFISNRSIDTDW